MLCCGLAMPRAPWNKQTLCAQPPPPRAHTNARISRYHPHDLYRSTLRRTDIMVMVIRIFECICLLASGFCFLQSHRDMFVIAVRADL